MRIIFVAITSLILITGMVLVYVLYIPFSPKKNAESVDIIVRWGSSFGVVAAELAEKNVVRSVDQLKFTATLYKQTQKLRVGKFTLKKGMSNYDALMALVKGPQSLIKFTLPNGYDSRRFAKIIERYLEIDSVETVALISDSSFIAQLGVNATSLEGYLYPETYNFTYGLNAKNIITALVHQHQKMVSDTLLNKIKKQGWTMKEVLTLASIIEGEAMVDTEMPIISSVYHNRLAIGMPLQADPTIQYIIQDGPRRLLRSDLNIDSPYNTYKYKGLPPGPINNPGINAIMAAISPAQTKYLYFVANGDGTHSFSETYSQHLRAKKRFDEYRAHVEKAKQQKADNE
ncbi:endolytic transglycosylase MltG [candidate division KSB1 bacterium]|nr:endolytic transglycosylase MltG [candidate division KSB1 bacterium]